MTVDYEVRPYQPGDEEGIIDLLDHVFDGWPHLDLKCEPLDFWKWKFTGSPVDESIIVLSTSDDEIIGCHHGLPLRIKMGENTYTCLTGVDLAVHKDYRRMGVRNKMRGLFFELGTRAGMRMLYAITGNPILIEASSRHYDSFPHPILNLVRIRDISMQLEEMPVDSPWIMKFGFHLKKLISNIENIRGPRKPSIRDVNISEVNRFDDRIDIFWEEATGLYDFILERKRDYLNWRYCDPRAGDFVVKQVEDDDGRLLGYSVLRINRYRDEYPIGYIVDLITLPERMDVADALSADAIRYFDDQNINIVNYQVVQGSPYERVLNRHGFLDSGIQIKMFYYSFGKFDVKSQLEQFPAYRTYLSWGDHDVLPVKIPSYR